MKVPRIPVAVAFAVATATLFAVSSYGPGHAADSTQDEGGDDYGRAAFPSFYSSQGASLLGAGTFAAQAFEWPDRDLLLEVVGSVRLSEEDARKSAAGEAHVRGLTLFLRLSGPEAPEGNGLFPARAPVAVRVVETSFVHGVNDIVHRERLPLEREFAAGPDGPEEAIQIELCAERLGDPHVCTSFDVSAGPAELFVRCRIE